MWSNRRRSILDHPPVTVRRWTGDREADRNQAWSYLSDADLERIIADGTGSRSRFRKGNAEACQAELNRRRRGL